MHGMSWGEEGSPGKSLEDQSLLRCVGSPGKRKEVLGSPGKTSHCCMMHELIEKLDYHGINQFTFLDLNPPHHTACLLTVKVRTSFPLFEAHHFEACLKALAAAGVRPSLSWMTALVESSLPALPTCLEALVAAGMQFTLSLMAALVESSLPLPGGL
eukprot:1161145-Pelagomonas_calceolata.AAC.12